MRGDESRIVDRDRQRRTVLRDITLGWYGRFSPAPATGA